MSDAAGELADSFHLLRLTKLVGALFEGPFGFTALSDVANGSDVKGAAVPIEMPAGDFHRKDRPILPAVPDDGYLSDLLCRYARYFAGF